MTNVISIEAGRVWQSVLQRNEKTGNVLNRYDNIVLIVRGMWGHELRYNTMAEVPELRGAPYDRPQLGVLREVICRTFAVGVKAEDVSSAALQVAAERPYHPVQEYLRSLRWDGTHRLPSLCTALFGHPSSSPPAYNRMLTRWAVSAVARALDPGCQVDTVLILQGDPGIRKSRFFREMGEPWSGEGDVDTGREGCFALAGQFIWVWDELAGMLQTAKTRGYGTINGFVTRQCDVFRAPYRPNPIKHQRSTVICGTANSSEILDDPTGAFDRRAWIVPVLREIGDGETGALRDQLWAEATVLYSSKAEAGRWWFDRVEEAERARTLDEHRVLGGWDEPLSAWVASEEALHLVAVQGFLTVGDALAGLGVAVERRRDRALATEVGQSFRRIGWRPTSQDGRPYRPTLRGARVTAYRLPGD